MRLKTFLTSVSAAGLLIAASVTTSALAETSFPTLLAKKEGAGNPFGGGGGGGGGGDGGGGGGETPLPLISSCDACNSPNPRAWMHDDVPLAWGGGYLGARDPLAALTERGVAITFVDDFSSGNLRIANLGDKVEDYPLQHGEWTSREGAMIAPLAYIIEHDVFSGTAVTLHSYSDGSPGTFNVLNLSYSDKYNTSKKTTDLYTAGNLFTAQETSIINFAAKGEAFVAKSAGNDKGTAVGDSIGIGRFQTRDYLSVGLMDAAGNNPNTFSGVWVGALDGNSSVSHNLDGTSTVHTKVSIADYSTQAGTDERVNANYLMVGVDTASNGGLEGTSFAAPIVSGYAAIVASKHKDWTPLRVKNKLLDTARTDTINDYSLTVHGQGEASIYRAVAPICIETC